MTTQVALPVQLRAIEPADGDEVARVVYAPFADIHDHHRFERTSSTSAAPSAASGRSPSTPPPRAAGSDAS